MTDRQLRFIVKPAVFTAGLAPLAWLVYRAATDALSANPIDDITDQTGVWTLRFVMITLAVTPLRKISGWNWLIKLRRMVGLFAFFYGVLHFSTYMVLDHFFDWERIVGDIYKRPFITAGFTGFVLMVPLALTSTKGWIIRLGGKNWNRLHKLVYITGIAGVTHYLWLVKADIQRPLIYGSILAVLLGFRLVSEVRPRLLTPKRA